MRSLRTLPARGDAKEQSKKVSCVPAICSDFNRDYNPSRLCNQLLLEQMPGNIPKSAEGCCPSRQSSQRRCASVHLRASNLTPFMNSQSPKAHEVSMATPGKLLKGGFHTLLKLLGHYSPSPITLTSIAALCDRVTRELVCSMTCYI